MSDATKKIFHDLETQPVISLSWGLNLVFEKHGEAPTKEYLKDMQSPTPTPVIVKSHNIWEFAGCVLLILVIFVVVLVSVLKWQGHIDFNLYFKIDQYFWDI